MTAKPANLPESEAFIASRLLATSHTHPDLHPETLDPCAAAQRSNPLDPVHRPFLTLVCAARSPMRHADRFLTIHPNHEPIRDPLAGAGTDSFLSVGVWCAPRSVCFSS